MAISLQSPRYYALLYRTVTGEIMADFALASNPLWLQQINSDGTWTVQSQIGKSGGLPRDEWWDYTDAWRYSVAVCYGTGARPGDYICQAGPLISDQLMSESPPNLQLGGAGLWALLRMTMNILNGWNPANGFGVGADTTYTTSLQGIAAGILSNANSRNPMPIDIPAGPFSGTTLINYFGYDLASAGQRLQEITQLQNGPDVLLRPYFSDGSHIRHAVMLGTPRLALAGNPPVFEYPGDVVKILPTRNGSSMRSLTLEKGNGVEYATPLAFTQDLTLPNAGWPNLEVASISHSDSPTQTILQSWSDSEQALLGRVQSTWAVTLMTGGSDSPLGSFDPGGIGQYNVRNHCRLRDGMYFQRVLGFQNSARADQYVHILQDTSG